jgi:hypothetical protein
MALAKVGAWAGEPDASEAAAAPCGRRAMWTRICPAGTYTRPSMEGFFGGGGIKRSSHPVPLTYQPTDDSNFLSELISH